MEEKNKKMYSTILLLVGTLFIIISGGIFVSETWDYIPEVVKKLCLLAVTGAFFCCSDVADRRYGLHKTAAGLYYLGVSFAGFTVIAFLTYVLQDMAMILLAAMAVMSVPVIIHFVREKKILDVIFQILLMDGMAICFVSAAQVEMHVSLTLSMSVATSILAAFGWYCGQELPGEKSMAGLTLGAMIIHMVLAAPVVFLTIFAEENFFYTVFPAVLLAGSAVSLHRVYQTKVSRWTESISLLTVGIAISSFFVQNILYAYVDEEGAAIWMGGFLIGLVQMVVLKRREMLVINAIVAGLAEMIHLADLGDVYYPYAFCMAAATIIMALLEEKAFDLKNFAHSAIWMGIALNGIMAECFTEYSHHYAETFLMALLCLHGAQLCRKVDLAAAVLRTFSLVLVLGTMMDYAIFPLIIRDSVTDSLIADFHVEYNVILLGLGIVLLGYIWYHISNKIRRVQFFGVCVLLALLLGNNLMSSRLPNVLFLGIGTLIMLIVSTMMKQKKYVIASAATLILVVLYLTRVVWMSIAWWVYLFVAGIGLVIYAIKKEKAE